MLTVEREEAIVALVNKHGVVSVRELAELCDVTEMTIRRDLRRLESSDLLRRTRGGAVRVDHPALTASPGEESATQLEVPDALILAPVQNLAAHTMRERAIRNQIPLLAESAPFDGAIYLGPRNFEASFTLGRWVGEYVQRNLGDEAHVLDITHTLINTRARSAGFAHGLYSVLDTNAHITSINGRSLYSEAYQVALDALRLHPEINVIFGINDDSVLGGLQAFRDLHGDSDRVLAVNVGGEGKTLFDVLYRDGPLKACLALFPEVVGRMAIEGVRRLWAGESIGCEIITPSAILTPCNLTDYYARTDAGWTLREDAVTQLEQTRWPSPAPGMPGKRVSFVIHFRTHEWYQNLAQAMRDHAAAAGIHLTVEDVNADLKAEIRELRRLIGKVAASYVEDGEIVILDTGTYTADMAQFLDEKRDLTVITNSLDVFHRLQTNPNVRLTLTGGDYDPTTRAFVGRGATLLLQEIRADKIFVVAGGLSASFGLSSETQSEAEVRRAMIGAAREVVVLSDHTVLGIDSHIHVADLSQVDTVITDAGVMSAHRVDLNQRGIQVIVAGQVANGFSPCDPPERPNG
jgi:DeoR/GlpR family transcriptional regulator of sugar metabolism